MVAVYFPPDRSTQFWLVGVIYVQSWVKYKKKKTRKWSLVKLIYFNFVKERTDICLGFNALHSTKKSLKKKYWKTHSENSFILRSIVVVRKHCCPDFTNYVNG